MPARRGRRAATPRTLAPVLIVQWTQSGVSNATRSAPVTAASQAGDTLLVCVVANSTNFASPTCTDTQGNVYTLDGSQVATNPTGAVFRSPGATGGPGGTPTKALSTSDSLTLGVGYSGTMSVGATAMAVTGAGALDKLQFNGTGASVSSLTLTLNNAGANDSMVGCCWSQVAGGAGSWSAPFTTDTSVSQTQMHTWGHVLDAGAAGTFNETMTVATGPTNIRGAMWSFLTTSVTGTGAIRAKKIGLAGTGTYSPPITGTGALAAKKISLAGSGTYTAPITGTGALAAKKIALAGTGTVAGAGITGTGSIAAKKIALAGSATTNPPVSRANTLEGGTQGTTISAANSGGASGDAFSQCLAGTNATCAYDGTHAHSGTLAASLSTGATSANTYVSWALGPFQQVWGRFYYWVTASPTANTRIASCYASGITTVRAFIRHNSGGKLAACDSTSAILWTSTSALPVGQWVRVEFGCLGDPSAGQLWVAYYASPESTTPTEQFTSPATANLGGPVGSVAFGVSNQANVPQTWWDDMAISTVGPLGPTGAPPPITGTGAVAAKKIALAGTGTFSSGITGTGAIAAKKIALAGTGTASATPGPITGTGAVTAKKISLAGTGTVTAPVVVAPAIVPGPTLLPVIWDGLSLNDGDRGDGLTTVVTNIDGWYGSPALAGNDLARALTDGAIYGFKTVAPRVIAITGAVVAADAGSRAVLNAFARSLSAKAVAAEPVDLLVGEDEGSPDGTVTLLAASVRADSSQLAVAWTGRLFFTWTVELTAADPRLYEAAWQSAVVIPAASGGQTGRLYPLTMPRRYASATAANSVRLTNDGNAPVPVWATYTGDLSESRLTDGATTVHLAPLGAAQQITVNTETLTATAPGGVSRASYLMAGSAPLVIAPYATVTWSLYGTGGGHVALSWRGVWA
jgi:hypothetical protein